jgi:hypothetical protein
MASLLHCNNSLAERVPHVAVRAGQQPNLGEAAGLKGGSPWRKNPPAEEV